MSHERLPMSAESSVREWDELRSMGISHQAACERIGINVASMEARIRRARERGDF